MTVRENFETYILEEKECTIKLQRKYETLMCLGNGYIGMRSAYCEEYPDQSRLTLIAGLYDRQPNEEEELFALPDATKLSISVNGKAIAPLHSGSSNYSRSLNLKNGLMSYSYDCAYEEIGFDVSVSHRRFVSMEQLHLVAFETVIISRTDAEISVKASVDAKETFGGTQHIFEEEREVLEDDVMWYGGRAACNGTKFRVANRMRVFVNGEEAAGIQQYGTGRRYVGSKASLTVKKGDEIKIVRYALYYTENDTEWRGKSPELMREAIQREMKYLCTKSFDELLGESAKAWDKRWSRCDVVIDGDDPRDTLKTRLGLYHSIIMCPAHDDRVSIAAKGLTGAGYAGHVFWDCELFNLPFFIYTDPDAARKLCTYRYHTLGGARRKARKYGFRGAMYPWESTVSGDEQSVEKGNYTKYNVRRDFICGSNEHHVVCDVAYGVYNYAKTANDTEFMEKYALEILFETADFWQSRLDYNAELDRYEILDVIGPDEYKEHVDNNAFTNYMAAWNMRTALEEAARLEAEAPELFAKFDREIGLSEIVRNIRAKLPKLYLPAPNEDGLVPQDDTYLTLPQIDVATYKNSGINRYIYRFYTLDEISKLMVSKQADVIQLITLMPELFSEDIIRKNFIFYEDKCIHDSSLSLSAYAMISAKVMDADMALNFFRGALNTDFGETSNNCNAGIHAANCGGIWQCVVFGFAGMSAEGDTLKFSPSLPTVWKKLSFRLFWRGAELEISIDRETVTAVSHNGVEATVSVGGRDMTVGGESVSERYAK
ncbi:MAG: glycoside hydrolase family 65 protein [Clostridia bacterium]|nr:glycoside hydrolase family 65 protein [Clostridia bacterium]MBP3369987.1 glycoside hydrolase family 65 protein [Clostridia bacterium]